MTKRRVLVVDDEADIRTIVGLNLEIAGFQHEEVRNGAEALQALDRGGWDGCVLDLAMPEVDGFSVLKELQGSGRSNDLAILVLSATGTPRAALQALELGAHAHVAKPFAPPAVASALEELIEMDPDQREERRLLTIERAGKLSRLGVSTI